MSTKIQKWEDIKVNDIVRVHYVRKPDVDWPLGRDEIFYALIQKFDSDQIILTDIACTVESEMEKEYELNIKWLTGEFVYISSVEQKFELEEIISFQDKLKGEFPECFI